MNRENISKLIAHLETQTDTGFSMNYWFNDISDLSEAEREHFTPEPECGTIACIAGHAVLIMDPDNREKLRQGTLWTSDVPKIAAGWLGIDYDTRVGLFLPAHREFVRGHFAVTRQHAIGALKALLEAEDEKAEDALRDYWKSTGL